MANKSGRQSLDLTGRQFDRLTVIERAGVDRRKSTMWLCRCVCRGEKTTTAARLLQGKTRSCGCLADELRRNRVTRPEGESARNALYGKYKIQAKRRRIDFQLSFEDFIDVTGRACYYCGSPPKSVLGGLRKNGLPRYNGDYSYNGVDRLDPKGIYEVSNVVACCRVCNFAKAEMTHDEFVDWVLRAANHLRSKENT